VLYYLFRYLGEFGVSGANLWHYISFRALLTLVLSLLISMWLGQYFIKWMKKHGGSEAQRDASIDPYGVGKKGVPTMGGVMIIVATVIPCCVLLIGAVAITFGMKGLSAPPVTGTPSLANESYNIKLKN
jgi:phospho-N-acetylmuramoyl-pentapeptide-transferase